MDPLTHTLAGVTIGIVTSQLPGFKENPNFTIGVAMGSSVIPDIDVITKLFKNKNYISYHRSLTHSLLGLPILALIPPLVLFWFFNTIPFSLLYLFSLFCIMGHVFLDLLNPYGTKFFPHKNFVSFGVIYTFDPIFLGLLLTAIFSINISIYMTYAMISTIIAYFILRLWSQQKIKKRLTKLYPNTVNMFVLSRIIPYDWNIIIEFEKDYIIANYRKRLYNVVCVDKKEPPQKYKAQISFLKEYKAFLQLSYCYTTIINTHDNICEVSLVDLKYRKKDFFYFRAVFRFQDDALTSKYIGWVFSDKGFNHKLDVDLKKEHKYENRKH